MVKLRVKRNEVTEFWMETFTDISIEELTSHIAILYNGKLKLQRICNELEGLSRHGVCNTEETSSDTTKWEPEGGSVIQEDPTGSRTGLAPNQKMVEIIGKTFTEVRSWLTSSDDAPVPEKILNEEMLIRLLDMVRDTIKIVYPDGLPSQEPLRRELENTEDLAGDSKVIDPPEAQLWWAGKELERSKKLKDYIGNNEKTKIVVKLQKRGQCAPSREPRLNEDEQKQMMLHMYRRQEELKRLDEENDDSYLNSRWADGKRLHKSLHKVGNITWKS